MPTVFSHPAVPLAIGLGMGRDAISRRLLLAGVVASTLPDLDVLAFDFGIPYSAELGHRGFSHSLFFAGLVALVGACGFRALRTSFVRAFMFLFVATASHGVLDAFTNGGLGIAFFWPWSAERYFAPFQVIEVAPLSASRLFSQRGVFVLLSEVLWVWLPSALVTAALAVYRAHIALTSVRSRPASRFRRSRMAGG